MKTDDHIPEQGLPGNEASGSLNGNAVLTLPTWLTSQQQPHHGGYFTVMGASCGHALQILFRRRRLAMAALIAFLPVLIPIAMSYLALGNYSELGDNVFVRLAEDLFINVFTPLLALFFAGMLVAEDIEMRTMIYILVRPTARSAWVFGRFIAFMIVASAILLCACALTFAASTLHANLELTRITDLTLLFHYMGVIVLALLAYGSLSVFLGTFSKRPIVYGVIFFYGWQYAATLIPGLIDFFTVRKYIDALLPIMATQRNVTEIQTALGTFQREVFLVSAGKALLILFIITAIALGSTIIAVQKREYAADRASGG
ncbi:MAG: ABC transporter permease [Candidatus Hydrogenedentales bacterium]|jgi:ABC-2 type transport system permease protein